MANVDRASRALQSTHGVGIICGLAAGAWLGGAEVPVKIASPTISPFAVSLCMVAGVFVARWTIPALLKGSDYIFADLKENRHLVVWGVLAGALWAVANTLTVFAIRDVGLAIAFPLWNTNCLVGIFWGWLLFNELRGASAGNWLKVLGGTLAILLAALMLAYSSTHGSRIAPTHAHEGILAAAGASLLWGTMYIPYRKAYLSGMNPLSFVTVFTVGELGMMLLLTAGLGGGFQSLVTQLNRLRRLSSGCFSVDFAGSSATCSNSIRLSIWELAAPSLFPTRTNYGALPGELWSLAALAATGVLHHVLIIAGSIVMLLGTLAISTSVASDEERSATRHAILRECERYSLDYLRVLNAQTGRDSASTSKMDRRWWDYAIAILASGVFVVLAVKAERPPAFHAHVLG